MESATRISQTKQAAAIINLTLPPIQLDIINK